MCLPVKPYKVEREWEYAGLKCAVVQAREQGHRCGYVRIPPGHPDHGKPYDDINVEVHGGLTYANDEPCVEADGRGYWVGFDCAHAGDMYVNPHVPLGYEWKSPQAKSLYDHRRDYFSRYENEHYWTEQDVVNEVNKLAVQLANHKVLVEVGEKIKEMI